jgi:hypothetical protein
MATFSECAKTLRFIAAWAVMTLCLCVLMFFFLVVFFTIASPLWDLVSQDPQILKLAGTATIIGLAAVALPLTLRFIR